MIGLGLIKTTNKVTVLMFFFSLISTTILGIGVLLTFKFDKVHAIVTLLFEKFDQ